MSGVLSILCILHTPTLTPTPARVQSPGNSVQSMQLKGPALGGSLKEITRKYLLGASNFTQLSKCDAEKCERTKIIMLIIKPHKLYPLALVWRCLIAPEIKY